MHGPVAIAQLVVHRPTNRLTMTHSDYYNISKPVCVYMVAGSKQSLLALVDFRNEKVTTCYAALWIRLLSKLV